MPKLPTRNELRSVQIRGEQPILRGVPPIQAEAGIQLGNTLANVGLAGMAQAKEMQQRKAALDASEAEAKSAIEMIKAESEFENDDDYLTMENRYRERVSKSQGELLNGVSDPERRQMLQNRLSVSLETGAARIQSLARKKEVDVNLGRLNDLVSNTREAVLMAKDEATRSGLIGTVNEAIESARSNGYMSDVQASQTRQKFAEDYALGAAEMLSPQEQLANLKSASGIYSFIPADKRSALIDRAQKTIQAEQDRALLRAERADVKAERTLNEIDRQISSGVPATPQMWDTWQEKIQGSSFESDFKARMEDEKQVQQVLRLPVAEQARYAQERQAKLQSQGGDVREAANVNRLVSAVQSNMKKLSEAPLLYAEEMTGDRLSPIDLGSLTTDPETMADQIGDRIATLGVLRKQHGAIVQNRPLLPQEAQQLTAAINKATPQDQVEIFGALRKAISDNGAYMGAMQQIAPDSPVKAAAGALMSIGGNQVTQSRMFGADDIVSAQKAASTMLTGEAILNKSKADSAADGKPVNMPVPSAKEFSEAFQSQVGNAFAGRPQAFELAMQAARAHYVGSAAESGEFASVLDTERLRKSVKASLGDVVKFKSSDVILPWGMDESTFRDRLGVKLNEALRARGLAPDQINREVVKLPRMDVVNFGAGEYMILDSARRPYLANGQPVVLKMDGAQ